MPTGGSDIAYLLPRLKKRRGLGLCTGAVTQRRKTECWEKYLDSKEMRRKQKVQKIAYWQASSSVLLQGTINSNKWGGGGWETCGTKTHMREIRNACRMLVRNRNGLDHFWDRGVGGRIISKLILKMPCTTFRKMLAFYDMESLVAANTGIMNLRVLLRKDFLSRWTNVSFSRRHLLHEDCWLCNLWLCQKRFPFLLYYLEVQPSTQRVMRWHKFVSW